jgi:hypothetical protein
MPTDDKQKLTPQNWERFLRDAKIHVEDLDASKSAKSRAVKIGLFLSRNVGRTVPIDVKGRTGQAVLKVAIGRSKEKKYYFEVTWDQESDVGTIVPVVANVPRQAVETECARQLADQGPPIGEKETQLERGQDIGAGNTEEW